MEKITIIIVTYKDLKSGLVKCLDNLVAAKKEIPGLEVMVRDNGSKDGIMEILSKYSSIVKVTETENVGLSVAFNQMLKDVTTEYVLFMGSDAYPDVATLKGLCKYFDENPDVKAATTKLVLADGSVDMDAHRAFPTPWNSLTRLSGIGKLFPKSNLFNGYFLPNADLSKPHEIDMCVSHFMFSRKSFIEKIGGFDEDYFLYGEDVDICYRIKQNGGKIMYLPMWETLHMKGGSVGIRKTTRNIEKKSLEHRLKSQRLSTLAMELFVRKHYFKKYPPLFCYLMIYSTRVLGVFRVYLETLRK